MRKNRTEWRDSEFSILALDDDRLMTVTLQSYFQSAGYRVDIENDPTKGIERIRDGGYDILLLDFLMSPICGDEVVAQIRQFNKEIFIILLTGHKSLAPPIKTIRELEIQGYYEKSDRFDQLELLVESCVKSIRQMRMIRQYRDELRKTNDELRRGYLEMVVALRSIVDARDIYTRGHSDRVSHYAALIAREMGESDEVVERVALAGLFHDIGKIATPDEILLKDSSLTDEEYAEIKKHPATGRKILSNFSSFDHIIPIVESHHEWYDGTGYPNGIGRDELPLGAQMISVADAYDAMTSKRRYRVDMTQQQAMDQLIRGKGTQFDAAVVDVFLEVLKKNATLREDLEWTFHVQESAGMRESLGSWIREEGLFDEAVPSV